MTAAQLKEVARRRPLRRAWHAVAVRRPPTAFARSSSQGAILSIRLAPRSRRGVRAEFKPSGRSHAAQIDVRKSVLDTRRDAEIKCRWSRDVESCTRHGGVRSSTFAGGRLMARAVPPATEEHPSIPRRPLARARHDRALLYLWKLLTDRLTVLPTRTSTTRRTRKARRGSTRSLGMMLGGALSESLAPASRFATTFTWRTWSRPTSWRSPAAAAR